MARKCGKSFLFVLLLLFVQGCEMNKSVDFVLNEPIIYTENDVVFSVNWENGIPLYYFKHATMITSFILNLETDLGIENVFLESYTIKIPELEINVKRAEQYDIDIMDTVLKPNSIATKRYWGGKSIKIEGLLSNVIENEEQLEKFKNVKHIELIITIVYTLEGIEKSSELTWRFSPIVRKSNSFLDKLMSV